MTIRNTVRVITDGGSGTSYYLSGYNSTPYTGSGTPWTVESTSPYELALNDVTGNIFTPTAPVGETAYLGGAPFSFGGTLLYVGYNDVVEEFGLQLRANSLDNAVELIRNLRRVMNTSRYTLPAALAVQGGTNTIYFEIKRADIQESPAYLQQVTARLWRTTVRLVRSATGGLLTTPETVVNNITLNNRGTGSPTNNTAYSTGSGDLIYEGSPINIVATGNNGVTTWGASAKTFFASILANSYLVSGATLVASTGGVLGARSTFDLSPLLTNIGVRLRLCAALIMPGGNPSYAQIECYFGTGTSGTNVYTSPRITVQGSGVNSFYDFGFLPANVVRRAKGLTAPNLYSQIRVSTNGGAAGNFTLTDFQFITYYDWCAVEFVSTFAGNETIQIDSFPEQTNAMLLPYTPKAWHRVSSTAQKSPGRIRGTAPRYFSGSRLFWAWNRTDGTYNAADNVTFTATHAPQYLTLRGAG